MNKYQAINRETKSLKHEYVKINLSCIASITNREKIAPKLERGLEICAILSALQIMLNKDVYDMDEERLNAVLEKLKINPEDFHKQIDMYNSLAYSVINRYIDYLVEIKNVTDIDEKYYIMEKIMEDNSSIVEKAEAQIDPGMYNIPSERIAQIDDIVQTIYDSTIKSKITSDKSKDSDLIKSVYDRKK